MQNIQAEHAFPPSWTDKTKPGGGGGGGRKKGEKPDKFGPGK